MESSCFIWTQLSSVTGRTTDDTDAVVDALFRPQNEERLILNVRGSTFEVDTGPLDRVQDSTLAKVTLHIYLFIYCHLYSAFSIVQCSNALYRLWDGEIQEQTCQPSVWEIDAHTMYNQWATVPGRSLNYPRPKSITHLCTFSDNGVYVALQLFLVILVSDQWRQVLIPYSYRQVPWGLLHTRGWLSRYTWDQRLYVVSEPRETLSNVESQVFTHYNFGSSRDRTSDLLTTRPTCYHSATALSYILS